MNKWLRLKQRGFYDNINDEQTDGKYFSVCHSSVYSVVLYLSIESAGADGW